MVTVAVSVKQVSPVNQKYRQKKICNYKTCQDGMNHLFQGKGFRKGMSHGEAICCFPIYAA
jgi:hypothetical protein